MEMSTRTPLQVAGEAEIWGDQSIDMQFRSLFASKIDLVSPVIRTNSPEIAAQSPIPIVHTTRKNNGSFANSPEEGINLSFANSTLASQHMRQVVDQREAGEQQYMCKLNCGYAGSFREVEVHEATCRSQQVHRADIPRPGSPAIQAGSTQIEFDDIKKAFSDVLEDMKKKLDSDPPLAWTSGSPADSTSADGRMGLAMTHHTTSTQEFLVPHFRPNSPAQSPIGKLTIDDSKNRASFAKSPLASPPMTQGKKEYTCEFLCGYTAGFSEVEAHEATCRMRPAARQDMKQNAQNISSPAAAVSDLTLSHRPKSVSSQNISSPAAAGAGSPTFRSESYIQSQSDLSPTFSHSPKSLFSSLRSPGPVAYTGLVVALGPECCLVSPSDPRFNLEFVDEALAEILSLEEECHVSVHQVSSSIQGERVVVTFLDADGPGAVSSKTLSQTLMMQALNPDSLLRRRGLGIPLLPIKEANKEANTETTVNEKLERDLAVVALCKLVRDQQRLVEKMGDEIAEIKTLQRQEATRRSSKPQKIGVPLYEEEKDEGRRESKLEELRRLTRIPYRSEWEDKLYRVLRDLSFET